jgi:pimeloyl-ACP methyl ester carboxylesterase
MSGGMRDLASLLLFGALPELVRGKTPRTGPRVSVKAWRGFWLAAVGLLLAATATAREHVILLHGLARTERSMAPMQRALEGEGFGVTNLGYPSRARTIAELSETIEPALAAARREGAERVHFVTHSMGGILVRSYLSRHAVPELGRVVMLAPPSQGSEVVDALGGLAVFGWVNGPAGRELGTDERSMPNQLGPVNYPVGVIAGNRSINWINSLLIPGEDDGKVSLDRTKLAGMADHLVLPVTHPFILRDETAIRQTICFLRTGRFTRVDQEAANDLPSAGRAD